MKRVSVINLFGNIFGQDMLDPTAWIAQCVSNNVWGLPKRWINSDQCSPSDIASALQSQVITLSPAIAAQSAVPAVLDSDGKVITPEIPASDAVPAVTVTQYQLPAQYTITITDVSAEYKQRDIDAWVAIRSTEADADIQVLLGNTQDTTHLMMSLYDLTIATNVLGNSSAQDISSAKTRILAALQLMQSVNTVRTQRDADIAAYIAANPVS